MATGDATTTEWGAPGVALPPHTDDDETTVQLSPPPADEVPRDLASGLAARAIDRGQRPAVTVLGAAGRAEQGFVTLAQWAAKGAHLLLADAFVAPGDAVLVDLPPGWQLAAVCSAVWWVGGVVVTDATATPDGVVAGVVHESRHAPAGVDPLYVVGDAVDGGTTGPGAGAAAAAIGSWAEETQAFPDQPPPPAARPELPAVRADDRVWTHADAIATVRDGAPGTVGLDTATWRGTGTDAVLLVAARPVATGRTTLVLRDGLDRGAADGDRVRVWS